MELEEQVAAVIGYSQKIDHPNITALLKEWREAKKSFIKLFGDNLIYQHPIPLSFPLGLQEKKERINHFIQTIDEEYGLYDLSMFLESQKDGFFDNKVIEEYEFLNPEGTQITVPVGMKLIKAFKFFVPNVALLHRIQDEASMIVQENKLTGHFCMSVHPLDYLSSSENQYKWRSCHALNGDYRAGNLSYMCDKSTVVCYIKGDDEVELPNFPSSVFWNNKKWRMLLHFSEDKDLVFAARPYPFALSGILTFIQTILGDVLNDKRWCINSWTDYHTSGGLDSQGNRMEVDPHIVIQKNLYPIKQIVQDKSSLHFNDVLRSSVYTPFYLTKPTKIERPLVEVGSNPKCCQCGKRVIEYSDVMRCDACELEYGTEDTDGFTHCDHCHKRLYRFNLTPIMGGNNISFVCSKCCAELALRCTRCGMHIEKEFLTQGLCPDCRERRNNNGNTGNFG